VGEERSERSERMNQRGQTGQVKDFGLCCASEGDTSLHSAVMVCEQGRVTLTSLEHGGSSSEHGTSASWPQASVRRVWISQCPQS